jgi:hypothetical protein
LSGTSTQITVNGRTTSLLLYYTSANQISGLLPSGTPPGTGTITVTYNGQVGGPSPITVLLNTFGEYTVTVHHTPGHCPGGVCLQIGRTGQTGMDLFVGDTLFASSVGRTDLPGGDYATLMRSITQVLFPLGDAAIVHPGHGPDTTIRRERTTNPFVLEYFAGR